MCSLRFTLVLYFFPKVRFKLFHVVSANTQIAGRGCFREKNKASRSQIHQINKSISAVNRKNSFYQLKHGVVSFPPQETKFIKNIYSYPISFSFLNLFFLFLLQMPGDNYHLLNQGY